MYTFLITQDNNIIATERDEIIENSSLSDTLQFIVEKRYNEFDMRDFSSTLFYTSPVMGEFHNEELTIVNDNYKGKYYCYKLPADSYIVKEAGDVAFNISFKMVDTEIDQDSGDEVEVEHVRNISKGHLKIIPVNSFKSIPKDSRDYIDRITAIVSTLIEQTRENVEHYPMIQDGYWYVWDTQLMDYVNTDIRAEGEPGEPGRGIQNTYLNNDFQLTFEFTDGTIYTTDPIRGEKGDQGEQGIKGETGTGISSITFNDNYTLTIHMDDGTSYITDSIRGEQGEQGQQGEKGNTGNGIYRVRFNDDYSLTFTMTNGDTYTTPPIRGQRGEAGRSIINTVLNPDYTLTLTFNDGGSYTTPSIRGATGAVGAKGNKGDKGDKGDRGIQGYPGTPGEDGVGISSAILNNDYTLTLNFTDGTSTTTNSIRGEKGEAGQDGKNGIDGVGISNIIYNQDYSVTFELSDGTSYTTESLRGQQGESGQNGQDGKDGEDGYSPTATITKSNGVATITITDKNGTTTETVSDGQDGHSPVITTTKSGKTTTILSDGASIGTVLDGNDGQDGTNGQDGYTPVKGTDYFTAQDKSEIVSDTVTAMIDDTAGDGDTDKVWSADKLVDELAGKADVEIVETVSGSTPSITAVENTRYICGTVSTLSFTPCNSGISDIRFTSGSTPTVLTVPNTVKFPAWFDPTSLEANCIYEINILDGVYGAVMAWT